MNNHDELSYIKIITRIIETMSEEQDKLKREINFQRMLIIVQFVFMIGIIVFMVKG